MHAHYTKRAPTHHSQELLQCLVLHKLIGTTDRGNTAAATANATTTNRAADACIARSSKHSQLVDESYTVLRAEHWWWRRWRLLLLLRLLLLSV